MSKTGETQSWNPDVTLERLGGDKDLFLDMLHIFLEEAPKQIQALRSSIATGDAGSVEHAAHRLKGDLGYLNAGRAVEHARILEDAGHKGDLTHVSATLADLEAELEMVLAAMRTVCADTERA